MNKVLFEEKKTVAAEYYDGKCFVCERKFGKGFTFHHLWYNIGEPTYRDFAYNEDYQIFVLKAVAKMPDQFILLCKKHHVAVERLKRYKIETFRRLLKAVNMSRDRGSIAIGTG